MNKTILGLWAFALLQPVNIAPVRAADSDFYRGKTVTIAANSHVGTYAGYAHLLVAHMSKHIPGNPSLVFQVVPGAGGLAATNHAYSLAPRNGTHLLVVVQTYALDQALRSPGVRYDAKRLPIIGRFNDNTPVAIGWNDAGIKSIEDAKSMEVLAGGTGSSSPTDIFPMLMNATTGTRFKLVTGYKSLDEISLAMQRGEVQSLVTSLASLDTVFEPLRTAKKINILVQFSLSRHPTISDVPTAGELTATAEGRALANLVAAGSDIGRMLISPPEVPDERIAILRAAFDDTLKDADFLADSAKAKMTIGPSSIHALEKIVDDTLSADPAVIDRARAILGVK